jgi:transposase-like protein
MYTNDKKQERVRRDCAQFAKKHGVHTAARRYGVSPGTVSKWCKLARRYGHVPIPTKSSRPKHSPRALDTEVVRIIINIRLEHNRSAEVVHKRLRDEHGVVVSLSSVKRTLDRHSLLRKCSPWKRLHLSKPRPEARRFGTGGYHPSHENRWCESIYLHLS